MPSDTWKLLNDARKFIEAEYSDPSAAPDGEWLAKEARPIHDRICTALANYSASIPAELDAVDMDMIQRGDRLGPELGARVASALLSLSARVGELERELRETDCPRPCNHQPDDLSVGQCVDAGECGCRHGAPLIAAEAKLAGEEVTEAMVEAACKGYWPAHWPANFDKNDADSIRSHMRAALEAALRGDAS